jgi:glucokinase
MDELMERIFAAADAVIERAAAGRDRRILGVGIGFFGLIDRARGEGVHSLRLDMRGYPIAARFRDRYRSPVLLDNDAHVAVLGEMTSGAARGHRDVVQLNLGTSLASGVAIDGEILRGPANIAGELGHFTVQTEQGEPCFCGRSGCALNYVSGTALRRRLLVELDARPDSLLWERAGGDPAAVHLAMLEEALSARDPAAEAAVNWSLGYLSALVSSLVALFNPSIVVIGGGVSHLGDRLIVPLKERVHRDVLHPVQRCDVVSAELVQESGLVGALVMIVASQGGGEHGRALAQVGAAVHEVMEGLSV